MAVSKRLRYEVLRRDNYTCRYCGAKAPDVPLTVDHVVPTALGGTDKPDNLVAACGDCSGGKTSSSPDAPVVANVAADALRWSQAMAVAGGEMLAKASGDIDARAHFEQVWNRFGAGPKREPIPKDPGWQSTVDNLLRAGLPMALLEECVEIAMGQRRVSAENVFRYMCGVAWRKVHELRERAGELVNGEPVNNGQWDESDPNHEDVQDYAISNWCRLMLEHREPEDVARAKRECLERAGDEATSGVLWFIIHNLEMDRAELAGSLRALLETLSGEIGTDLIQKHEDPRRSTYSTLGWAADDVTGHFELIRARRELDAMPADEREAWMQWARAEWAGIAEHVDETFYIREAADKARQSVTAAASKVEA